jgi:hypothetical protein
MLLRLKEYVIANKDNKIWTDAAQCGPFVMARLIDEFVDDYNRTKTTLMEVENERQIYYNECGEWDELGFPDTPADMSEERVAELKALAEKWRKEDETDADGA